MIDEEVTVNVGSGHIAGLDGNPPVGNSAPLIRRSRFAGHEVFEVTNDIFHECRMGKLRYHRYDKYVGNGDIGNAIKEYGKSNPSKPIIVKHEKTGALQFLKYGKR